MNRFDPTIDGIPVGLELSLGTSDLQALARLRLRGAKIVANRLRAQFSGAFELYSIGEYLRRWSRDELPLSDIPHRGLAITAVDAFTSRTLPLSLRGWRRARAYAMRRSVDGLAESEARVFEWRVLRGLIPERWVPSRLVAMSLEVAIARRFGVESTTLALAVGDQHPGGHSGLQAMQDREWRRLKSAIDAGRPMPARLLRERSTDLRASSVIAYQYDELKDGRRNLRVFDVATGVTNTVTLIEPDGSALDDRTECHGVICERFVAGTLPRSWFGRVLGTLGFRRLARWVVANLRAPRQ